MTSPSVVRRATNIQIIRHAVGRLIMVAMFYMVTSVLGNDLLAVDRASYWNCSAPGSVNDRAIVDVATCENEARKSLSGHPKECPLSRFFWEEFNENIQTSGGGEGYAHVRKYFFWGDECFFRHTTYIFEDTEIICTQGEVEYGPDADGNPRPFKCVGNGNFTCPEGRSLNSKTGECEAPVGKCSDCPQTTSPVAFTTGNKYFKEKDFESPVTGGFRFDRHYSSHSVYGRSLVSRDIPGSFVNPSPLGPNWRHSYQREIGINFNAAGAETGITVKRANGQELEFLLDAGNLTGPPNTAISVSETYFAGQRDGWKLVDTNNTSENYDETGRLIAITHPYGFTQTLDYDLGPEEGGDGNVQTLDRVTGPFGRTLRFEYDAAPRLVAVKTGPPGTVDEIVFTYSYNRAGMLAKVTYPEQISPSEPTNDPFREYRYDSYYLETEPGLVLSAGGSTRRLHLLTQIIDENGDNFATVEYDTSGMVSLSERGDGAERTRFSYNFASIPASAVVTTIQSVDAAGNDLASNPVTYTFTLDHGNHQIQSASGTCPTCSENLFHVTYDLNGFRDEVTDRNGNVTDYDYDSGGRLTQKIEAKGSLVERVTINSWDSNSKMPASVLVKDGLGNSIHETRYEYWNHRIKKRTEIDHTSHTDPERVITHTYYGEDSIDASALFGLVKQTDGPLEGSADITQFEYEIDNSSATHRVGDLRTVTNALGHATTYHEFDAHGRPTIISDPNGLQTLLVYHPRGWLLARSVNGDETTFEYDNTGSLRKVVFPDGSFYTYEYDAAHRLKKISDALGGSISYELDAMGNRTMETTETPAATTLKSGRIVNAKNLVESTWRGSLGSFIRSYSYDPNGNLLTTSIPETQHPTDSVTTNFYDALNRIEKATDALSNNTQFFYDALDNIVQINDPKGNSTVYERNGYGDVKRLLSPDTGITTFDYDSRGNEIRRDPPNSDAWTLSYDALSRLTSINYPTLTPARFTYDEPTGGAGAIGRLTTMTDDAGSTELRYDIKGNLIEKKFTTGVFGPHKLTYAYNSDDQVSAITYPSGLIVSHQFDANGHVDNISTNISTESIASNVRRRTRGRVLSYDAGANHHVQIQQDSSGKYVYLTRSGSSHFYEVRTSLPNDHLENRYLFGFGNYGYYYQWDNYEYDRTGQVTSIIDAGSMQPRWEYEYDDNGNRLERRRFDEAGYLAESQSLRYEPESNKRMDNASETVSYDPAGNIIADLVGALDREFQYNDAGRLATKTLFETRTVPSGTGRVPVYSQSSRYNAIGERVVTISQTTQWSSGGVPTTSNQILVDMYSEDGRLMATNIYPNDDPDTAIQETREWVYLDQAPIGLVVSEYDPSGTTVTERTAYFVQTDLLGTVVELIDGAGNVVWWRVPGEAAFNPGFGDTDPDGDGLDINPRVGFPGQSEDGQIYTYYNYFRDYDAVTGRYLESDPIGLIGGNNTYSYALNNPLRFTDPLGLWVMRCARKLGSKDGAPVRPKGNPLRHDYISVSGSILSFQAGSNGVQGMISSGGMIDREHEHPTNPECSLICGDDNFDHYVFQAANRIGAPNYCVWAYPGSAAHRGGSRNCQTWADDVIELARENYLREESCPTCFLN